MHPSPAQDHRTTQDTGTTQDIGTALQVPPSADLVIAPTSQDRAIPSEHAPCACPPSLITLPNHRDGCPDRA